MIDETLEPGPRYRIIGIRPDGNRAVVRCGMTLDEAKRVGDAIEETQLFASVYIEQESSDDIPLANCLRMSEEPQSGWAEFRKLLATYGVMLAIAAVVGLLAWLSRFWRT